MGVYLFEQFYDFTAACEVALDAEGFELVAEFGEFVRIGLVVDARYVRNFSPKQRLRHFPVCRKHKLLHKLVALVVFYFFNSVGVAVFIAKYFKLRHIQVEASLLHSALAHARGYTPQGAHHFLKRRKALGRKLSQILSGKRRLVILWWPYSRRLAEIVERYQRVRLLV